MVIDIYLILFILAIGSLLGAVKYKKLLLSIFATILFFVLAFQGLKIEYVTNTGATIIIQEAIIIQINYLLGVVSFIITLVGLVGTLRDKKSKDHYSMGVN